ncbi:hypothetical protein Bhyg_01388, partial [Pseudolycoriella hygida]
MGDFLDDKTFEDLMQLTDRNLISLEEWSEINLPETLFEDELLIREDLHASDEGPSVPTQEVATTSNTEVARPTEPEF